MSLVKLVPAWLHGLGDYVAGLVLIVGGVLTDSPDKAKATGIGLGLGLIVVSLLTRYPLGAVRVIPFPVHSAGDYGGGVLAILAPFILDFWDNHKDISTVYIVVGAVVLVLSLVTDYSWGPDRGRAVLDTRTKGHGAVA